MISYDIPKIFEVCDFVNLMSYDLHGPRESITGIHAALYQSRFDKTTLNVDYSVRFLLKMGVAKEKLILGIPTFGNGFTLSHPNPNYTEVGLPAVGADSKQFNEICSRIKLGSLNYRWDEEQKVPYAFKNSDWIGFDDVMSVSVKGNYIKTTGLGGAMISALDGDDYDGRCGNGTFPLTTTAFRTLISEQSLVG